MAQENLSIDSSSAMTVRFVHEREDILALMLATSDYSKPAYRRRVLRSVLLQLSMVIIGASLIAFRNVSWYGWLMVGYGLSGLLIWGPILAFPKRQIMRRVNLLGTIGEEGETVVTMDMKEVIGSTEHVSLTLRWGMIDSVNITESYIRFISGQGVIQIPLRAFEDNESRDSFIDTATQYYSAKNAAA